MAEKSLALIFGDPGTGKSFFALDLALKVATGTALGSRKVKQASVVYVCAEAQEGFRRRVAAYKAHHGLNAHTPFALVPTAIDLQNPHADLPRLIAAIENISEKLSGEPGLIVVDTLAATFGSGDENTKDMVSYVNNLAALKDRFGATVVAVHHAPKDPTNKTPRGHGSLRGAMDTVLYVDIENAKERSVSVYKQKDAEACSPIHFELFGVHLGFDEEGEAVGAAVVNYVQAVNAPVAKLSAGAAEFVDLLNALILDCGEENEATTEKAYHGRSIKLEDFREAYIASRPGEKRATVLTAFKRNLDGLGKSGRVQENHGRVWTMEPMLSIAEMGNLAQPSAGFAGMNFLDGAGRDWADLEYDSIH